MKTGKPQVKEKPEKEKKRKKQNTKNAKANSRRKLTRIRCPICFNRLAKESIVSTRCGHVFCRDCLQKALLVKSTCPTCRRKLTATQGYHALYLDDNVYDEFMDDVTNEQ